MKILITGSIAYDHHLEYQGLFKDILLADQLDRLSVCFYSPEKQIAYGGCAANIAYNLQLLKSDFLIYGRAGKDFGDYQNHFQKLNIDTSYILCHENSYTATAYITTDKSNNQITTFNPGAMLVEDKVDLSKLKDQIQLAIISPENFSYMMQVYEQCQNYKIPYVFDPGQQIPSFDSKTLKKLIKESLVTVTNDYEFALVKEKTGLDREQIIKDEIKFIITHGAQGSELIKNGESIQIKSYPADKIVDPTGCGDAYRAGLLHGLSQQFTWEKSCDLGSRIAAQVISHRGTQEHSI